MDLTLPFDDEEVESISLNKLKKMPISHPDFIDQFLAYAEFEQDSNKKDMLVVAYDEYANGIISLDDLRNCLFSTSNYRYPIEFEEDFTKKLQELNKKEEDFSENFGAI